MSSLDVVFRTRRPTPGEVPNAAPGSCPSMRQVFLLVLTLLVLKAFLPDVGHRLEDALLALLDLATKVFSTAQPLG